MPGNIVFERGVDPIRNRLLTNRGLSRSPERMRGRRRVRALSGRSRRGSRHDCTRRGVRSSGPRGRRCGGTLAACSRPSRRALAECGSPPPTFELLTHRLTGVRSSEWGSTPPSRSNQGRECPQSPRIRGWRPSVVNRAPGVGAGVRSILTFEQGPVLACKRAKRAPLATGCRGRRRVREFNGGSVPGACGRPAALGPRP